MSYSQSNEPKIYLKSFCKKKEFQNGGSIINISINKEDFNKQVATKGYVNLVLAKKKTPDQFGNTHYLYLSNYRKPAEETMAKTNTDTDLPF